MPSPLPDRVLIVDDVLATGGTGAASVRLIDAFGAEVAGFRGSRGAGLSGR